jgi:addiction module RelE/StbE family toxin
MMTEIYFSPRFKKSINKIPLEVIEALTQKQSLFIINPFNPALKTHKLTGKLSQYYSFSIIHSYRIIFEFLSKNKVVFVNIGTHEIYKK